MVVENRKAAVVLKDRHSNDQSSDDGDADYDDDDPHSQP